jgi:beta-phosphoglucomutase-like phosphatase (HAD superfamily)
MIKCVLFDCDGTLVDSEYLCNLALEINLVQLGIQESAISLMDRYRGWKPSKIVDELEVIHKVKLNETKYRSLVLAVTNNSLNTAYSFSMKGVTGKS